MIRNTQRLLTSFCIKKLPDYSLSLSQRAADPLSLMEAELNSWLFYKFKRVIDRETRPFIANEYTYIYRANELDFATDEIKVCMCAMHVLHQWKNRSFV